MSMGFLSVAAIIGSTLYYFPVSKGNELKNEEENFLIAKSYASSAFPMNSLNTLKRGSNDPRISINQYYKALREETTSFEIKH